jgi:uncharacterized membrane protein
MHRRTLALSVLLSAVGMLADAATAPSATAQDTQLAPGADPAAVAQTEARMRQEHLVKCYGINAAGRNDCATSAHACATRAPRASDGNSFVLLPSGDCEKIAGGALWANG